MNEKTWCLCRWREGNTHADLVARGEKNISGSYDPITGASFCGPLAFMEKDMDIPEHLQGLGFPGGHIGNVALFETQEAALAHATWDGVGKVAIDLPTPIAGLVFGVEVLSFWDGKTKLIYDGGNLRQARAERLLKIEDLGQEAKRYEVRILCWPLWDELRPYCPTPEQVAALNVQDMLNRQRSRESPLKQCKCGALAVQGTALCVGCELQL